MAQFGTPMIRSRAATFAERRYTALAAVAIDFEAGTPEYDAASRLFSYGWDEIAIGRMRAADAE